MSHRAELRRAARAESRGQRHVGTDRASVLVGWCATENDLPETRQRTHDALIGLMGRRRRGAVRWSHLTGLQAHAALSDLHQGASPHDEAIHDHYRRIGAMLREYGGYIVIASAPGDPTVSP